MDQTAKSSVGVLQLYVDPESITPNFFLRSNPKYLTTEICDRPNVIHYLNTNTKSRRYECPITTHPGRKTFSSHLNIAFTDESSLNAHRALRSRSCKVGSIDDIGVARDKERCGELVLALLEPARYINRQGQDAHIIPNDIRTCRGNTGPYG